MLVIYRQDRKFLLDPIIPKRGAAGADFDLVIASQPYRARATAEFKAQKVIAPLARSPRTRRPAHRNPFLRQRPGLEIVQRVWPDDNPFQTDRHAILREVKKALGPAARDLNFNTYADNRAIFQYDMHTLPSEVTGSIGTSTVLAAWNAAIYVSQVEDERLHEAVKDAPLSRCDEKLLRKHNGLWFNDESYVISRRRE